MRCYVNQLKTQLQKTLHPFYLVLGEEPFQVQQCISHIKLQAKQAGFEETIRFSVLPQFDWTEISQEYNSLSLFSDKRLLEIDFNQQKPGQPGGAALKTLAEQLNPDCIVIIKGLKAGQDIQRAAWFKALDKTGLFIPCYEINQAQLPAWLKQQCQQLQLNISLAAQQFLIDQTQGNLLACYQELEKLSLLYGNSAIDESLLRSVLLDQAKFDIFDLTDALLQGDAAKIIGIITNLKNNHHEIASVNWAISREAQQLYQLSQAFHQQQQLSALFKKFNIWQNKQALYQNAVTRIPLSQLQYVLNLLAQFDAGFKGGSLIAPWQALAHIGLCFTTRFNEPLPIYHSVD